MKPTLSIKKPTGPAQHASKQRIEQSLVGKQVILQTRSPSRICGEINSFENGWLVITGTEQRWLSDGSLSAPVTTGTFTLDRGVITYLAEVAE